MNHPDPIVLKRETLTIEGDRNLYLYTPEVNLPTEVGQEEPEGNLTSSGERPE